MGIWSFFLSKIDKFGVKFFMKNPLYNRLESHFSGWILAKILPKTNHQTQFAWAHALKKIWIEIFPIACPHVVPK